MQKRSKTGSETREIETLGPRMPGNESIPNFEILSPESSDGYLAPETPLCLRHKIPRKMVQKRSKNGSETLKTWKIETLDSEF